MWSLLGRKSQLIVVIGCGILVAWAYDAVELYFTGQVPNLLRQISITVTVVGGVLLLAAELIWRFLWQKVPLFRIQIFPDLNGKWTGTLCSTWVNRATGEQPPPIPTEIVIRQKLFSTNVSLRTGESRSHSTRAFLEAFKDTRRYRIWYSYNNEPKASVRHRSSQHEGVAYLELNYDEDQNRLVGRYYTARDTSGDIDVRRSTLREKR
jgi:hypothetical protein